MKLEEAQIVWCGRNDPAYGKLPANVALVKAGEPKGWRRQLSNLDGAGCSSWREYSKPKRLAHLIALMINLVRFYGLTIDEVHECFKGIDEYRAMYFSTIACKYGSGKEVEAWDDGYRGRQPLSEWGATQ